MSLIEERKKEFSDGGTGSRPLDAAEVGDDLHAQAREAYEAYKHQVESVTFDGRPMPRFEDLPLRVVLGWAAAAQAIAKTTKKESESA